MKNKFFNLLLAIVIALGLWAYVITSVSPGSKDTIYNILVAMEGKSVLEENGLIITGISTDRVDLTLSGTRRDLSKVNPENITLKVDLTKITEPGKHSLTYDITYPGDVPSNAFVEEARDPQSIVFTVEKRVHKSIPVEVKFLGSLPEGFLYDRENLILDNHEIVVTGPASEVDQIAKAVIEVDLSSQRESISQTYTYSLCDAEGNGVDAKLITTNVEQVRLDLKIQRFKNVNLVYTVIPGGGAAMETMVISAFGFPSIALPVLLMMTQLFDAGCTLINSCGDTVASMLVTRVLYGKDWYKKNLNKKAESGVSAE